MAKKTITLNDISVQIFDIMPDGCLNGLFINTATGKLFNEIARKTKADIEQSTSDSIVGLYSNSYIDSDGIWIGTLEISHDIPNNKFVFIWRDNNNVIDWIGDGWYIKPHQLILKYWKP